MTGSTVGEEPGAAAVGHGAGDPTFLAPPGQVADWRLVVLLDAADRVGLLPALPGSAEEVAERAGLDPAATRVVLDALGSWDLVTLEPGGRYHAGPVQVDGDVLLQIGHHARMLRRWATALDDRLRGVAEPADPSGVREPGPFLDSLAVRARQAAPAVVDQCLRRFPGAERVLELGGGHGEYGLEFARRGLQVTMQDRPAVIDLARERGRLEQGGVALFPGDMHEVLPDGPFDLAFCAGITHTFSGERNQALYRRLRPRMAPGGGIAVVTMLRRRDVAARLFAVQMMANAHGGDTHAEEEYRTWLEAAGFEGFEVHAEPGTRATIFAVVP